MRLEANNNSADSASARRLKILMIDDDEMYYLVAKQMLSQVSGFDCELHWQSSFADGLSAIRNDTYDLLLVDYDLGGLTGLELVQAAQQFLGKTPSIMLTGSGGQTIFEKAMDLGVAGYQVKQEITPSLLQRSIHHALRHAKALEALQSSEERYEIMVRTAQEGFWEWDYDKDEVYFSPRWKDLLGYAESEIDNRMQEWLGRVHPEDKPLLMQQLQNFTTDKRSGLANEHRIRCKNGVYRWFLCQSFTISVNRITGTLIDINDRKEAEEQLLYSIYHDNLTRLPNRTAFTERLHQVIKRAREKSEFYAVLHINLVDFKDVNDSMGLAAGDILLKKVAGRFRDYCTEAAMIARLGGDEFSILLEGLRDRAIRRTPRAIDAALARPIALPDGQELLLKARVGIVLAQADYSRPEDLLRDAAIAMRHAKIPEKGRCSWSVFNQNMYNQVSQRLHLEHDFRKALERSEFRLFLQPIVAAVNETIAGFEALVRWQHPTRGLLSPKFFIDCAEESGLIVPLGRWVIEESCRRIIALQSLSDKNANLSISVNLSVKQFAQPGLVQHIADVLQETRLDPASLKLEITESIAMENNEMTVAKLEQLRKLGVACHIDDFGTGYSSLSYLHRLPAAALKLDRSFVAGMIKSREHAAIAQSIVTLAHDLGLYVIAEGVETSDQLTRLRALGCEYMQGYWFYPPLDENAVFHLVSRGDVLTSELAIANRMD